MSELRNSSLGAYFAEHGYPATAGFLVLVPLLAGLAVAPQNTRTRRVS